jgi:hypothetical protein
MKCSACHLNEKTVCGRGHNDDRAQPLIFLLLALIAKINSIFAGNMQKLS